MPLPPEPEQTMLAEVLSACDRAIEQTQALAAKHHRIKIGLTNDLLTRGIDKNGNLRALNGSEFQDSSVGRIPLDWTQRALSHFVPTAEYGISDSLGEIGTPVLRMNNLKNGEAELSDVKRTSASVPDKLWLRPGDVLFNRTNSWEHVGRTGIWRGQLERATFASYLVRLNPNPKLLLQELLNIWLNWAPIQIRMRQFATPAVQQVNINPTNLRMMAAAFPRSRDEQQEIVRRIHEQSATVAAVRDALKKLQAIKTGLMQDLITGRRRVTPLLLTTVLAAQAS